MVERSLPSVVRNPEQTAQVARLMHGLSLLVILIPALFVSAVNLHVSYDDAFITYRYAYNLASGNGFVYNFGEWYMGTTAPLYGLLLGALGWPNTPRRMLRWAISRLVIGATTASAASSMRLAW